MNRIVHFVRSPEYRTYSVRGTSLRLYITPDIFPPSLHGSFFAHNITVHWGETVLDIGTGSGFLGILAAQWGGRVTAIDPDPKAIACAQQNAQLNNVSIHTIVGEYFGSTRKKYDVIIANLPQEIVHPLYRKSIGRARTRTIDGGPHGNRQLLHFLHIAKAHMHATSRLYVIVNTLTDYAETLAAIVVQYQATLVNFGVAHTKEFVEDHPQWYQQLHDRGVIHLVPRRKQRFAHEYLFELRLRPSKSR